ncbi:FAD-binding protein [Natrarchaeobaculum sulfurireducens]|uniref:Thioredoxin reductase n=1 Tax=Natrarchaeobaculum sulfurireducens TaxID=2044521 RepID=A0A346PC37_9EURY|nr:FAD-binding protein [Natrarchaeobaculum sulfurireducens]AXR77082.1 Thioredoxin reductase [Natrarchaeobaculum sulfurireducens]AXR82951.1 Thioredoxin reductase [Natrarchaeobaculum sulfurireducens]
MRTELTQTEPTQTEPTRLDSYDVAVVGAGPAGCAAGVFCARADLETVVLSNGRSTLTKCAYVENYLGFPAGIEPRTLLAFIRDHAREAGCTLREGTVETARQSDDTFELVVDGTSVVADAVIATSWADSDYLQDLDVSTEPEEPGPVDIVLADADGRTDVDGVYAAGRVRSTHHQALVAAGDGARVALTMIGETVPEFYNDWVAPEGYYASHDREIPVGVEEISHEERRNRAVRGRERLLEHLESGG